MAPPWRPWTQERFEQIVAQAVERARQSREDPVVELEITAAEGARSLQMTLPGEALNTLALQKGAALTVGSPVARVSFDGEALKAAAQQAEGEIVLTVSPVQPDELNEAQAAKAGEFPVVELTLRSNGKVVSDFRQGNATITLPYTLAPGQQAAGVVVWYLDETGEITICHTSYEEAAGEVTFLTPHFSKYVVAYDEARLPAGPGQTQPTDAPGESGSLPVLPILGGAALVLVLAALFGLRRYFLRQDRD